MANQFARYADALGIDVDRVIDAANSQPFSHIHRPGIAVGGHCIPVYPRFYLAGDPDARLPPAAREVNEAMPAYAVDLLGDASATRGRRVLMLGVAYRGGVKETAFSGAFALRDELRGRGAHAGRGRPDVRRRRAARRSGFDAVGRRARRRRDRAGRPRASTASCAADLPGARAVVDGRGVLDPARFAVPGLRIGGGQAASAASSATTRSPARPSP